MTVTTLNANGPTYENIKIAAEIAADHINSNGGINGRPLEVIVCDEQFDRPLLLRVHAMLSQKVSCR